MKRAYAYFTVVVILMASMDSFNFYFPHNDGFWSLNYKGSWDAWHLLKRGVLFVVFMLPAGFRPKKVMWWVHGSLFALIAYLGQRLIYNTLTKF